MKGNCQTDQWQNSRPNRYWASLFLVNRTKQNCNKRLGSLQKTTTPNGPINFSGSRHLNRQVALVSTSKSPPPDHTIVWRRPWLTRSQHTEARAADPSGPDQPMPMTTRMTSCCRDSHWSKTWPGYSSDKPTWTGTPTKMCNINNLTREALAYSASAWRGNGLLVHPSANKRTCMRCFARTAAPPLNPRHSMHGQRKRFTLLQLSLMV